MATFNPHSGTWKFCPECGRRFLIPDMQTWAYKRHAGSERGMTYLCRWNCMVAFEKRWEEEKKKRKSDAARRGHETRKKKVTA